MNHGKRILVAVDDDTVARWVVALIKAHGAGAALLALSAEQALAAIEQHPVGVVFADLVPKRGMHSFELAVIVADRYPGIPVICAADARSPPSGSSVGCTIIPKPYRSSDIVEAINATHQNASLGDAPAGEGNDGATICSEDLLRCTRCGAREGQDEVDIWNNARFTP